MTKMSYLCMHLAFYVNFTLGFQKMDLGSNLELFIPLPNVAILNKSFSAIKLSL